MDFQTAQQRAQQLREQIEYYSKLYYEQDDPAISDYDFDKLMHELIDIEEAYPGLLTPIRPPIASAARRPTALRRWSMWCRWARCRTSFPARRLRTLTAACERLCRTRCMWWSRRSTAFRSRWNTGTACWCAAPPAATALSARM